MKILSFHNSIEAGAALYINGKITSAISEERLNRIKNFHGFPKKSINFLLKNFKLSFKDFDYIVYGAINSINPDKETLKKIEQKKKKIPKKYFFKFDERVSTEINWNKKHITEVLKFAKKNDFLHKFILLDHHESHAASAYFCSPFKKALIFTFDGKGGFKSSSIYNGVGSIFERVSYLTTFDSLGYFYGNITRALGFKSERHEGKVTGLAAFGKKTDLINYFNKFIKISKNFFVFYFGKNYLPWFCDKKDLPNFYNKLSNYSKSNIAYAAQYILEKYIVHTIRSNIPKNKNINICLAGGIFANVKLNQKIREIKNIKNVYVQPAMGDAGIAIGAIYAFLSKKKS